MHKPSGRAPRKWEEVRRSRRATISVQMVARRGNKQTGACRMRCPLPVCSGGFASYQLSQNKKKSIVYVILLANKYINIFFLIKKVS